MEHFSHNIDIVVCISKFLCPDEILSHFKFIILKQDSNFWEYLNHKVANVVCDIKILISLFEKHSHCICHYANRVGFDQYIKVLESIAGCKTSIQAFQSFYKHLNCKEIIIPPDFYFCALQTPEFVDFVGGSGFTIHNEYYEKALERCDGLEICMLSKLYKYDCGQTSFRINLANYALRLGKYKCYLFLTEHISPAVQEFVLMDAIIGKNPKQVLEDIYVKSSSVITNEKQIEELFNCAFISLNFDAVEFAMNHFSNYMDFNIWKDRQLGLDVVRRSDDIRFIEFLNNHTCYDIQTNLLQLLKNAAQMKRKNVVNYLHLLKKKKRLNEFYL